MELSLPAWLGALCGMIVAVAIYVRPSYRKNYNPPGQGSFVSMEMETGGAPIGARDRLVTGRSHERQGGYELARVRDELAEMPETFEVRYVDVRAVEVDEPDAALGPQRGALGWLNLRRLPEELRHLLCGGDLTHLLRDRKALAQERRRGGQVSLLGGHTRHREERSRHRAVHMTGLVLSQPGGGSSHAQRTELPPKLKGSLPEGAGRVEYAARLPDLT